MKGSHWAQGCVCMWGDLGERWSQREHFGWGSPQEPDNEWPEAVGARKLLLTEVGCGQQRGRMELRPPLSLGTKNSLMVGLRERGGSSRVGARPGESWKEGGEPVGLTSVDWPQWSGVSEGE